MTTTPDNTQVFDLHDPNQLKRLIRAIDKFVPHQMLQLLGKKSILDVKLGDIVEREMTILFMDIRDFTTLSESMSPEDNFRFINSYFAQMEPIICAYGGIIDKFIGDAIMAIFPSPDEALKCAILMIKQLRRYNEGRERAGYQLINIGIGLNTGFTMIGTIGGTSRMEGTVISDAVNLASRIEATTKKYQVNLLISENTYYSLIDAQPFSIRFLDRILVKGKTQAISLYEVFDGDLDEVKRKKNETKPIFEEALAHFHFHHIEQAAKMLQTCVECNPADKPAQAYLARCQEFMATGRYEGIEEINQKLVWNDSNNIGHKVIDAQHYNLYEHMIKLSSGVEQGAEKAEIASIIEFLEQYVVEHFTLEEACMVESAYPFLLFHQREHAKFVQCFTNLKRELIEFNLSKTYLLFQIQIILIDWLLNHTLKKDKHFGKYLAAQKLGGVLSVDKL